MSPAYDAPPRRNPSGPEDLVGVVVLLGCAMLAFCWYIAITRLHLRNPQCVEVFMDCAALFFGFGLIIAQFAGRRTKREARRELAASAAFRLWNSGPSAISPTATSKASTVLGYSAWFTSAADRLRFIEPTLRSPCHGSPKHTFSDVEQAIREQLRCGTLLSRYRLCAAEAARSSEMDQLQCLEEKYQTAYLKTRRRCVSMSYRPWAKSGTRSVRCRPQQHLSTV